MNVLLLSEYDPTSEPFAEAVKASGIPVDEAYNVYTEAPGKLNDWGIAQLPCLVVVHDGKAIMQYADAADIPKASTWASRARTAKAKHDAAKAAQSA